jgi:hypothetical protein
MIWCSVDDCPATICGGPHRIIRTTLGEEIVRFDQKPIGEKLDASQQKEEDQSPGQQG